MGTYCDVADLLLGDLPVPENAAKYVQDATDEIDSKIGLRYKTPIVISGEENDAGKRATKLLLKRICSWLASGRIILAFAVSQEIQFQHAYGRSLVDEATAALNAIASGDVILYGVEPIDPNNKGSTGPIINNIDAESNVEAFYNFVQTNPLTHFLSNPPIWPAGSQGWLPYTW